jgi:hypothetical protein
MIELDTQWIVTESLWLITALALICMSRRRSKGFKCLTVLLALSIASHVLIFNNPAFFFLSNRMLSAAEIGWRQKDALNFETKRFIRRPIGLDYLFVGSSQVGAVFDNYAVQQRNCGTLSLAGMGPSDFFLYAREVERIKPRDVVLYLSDFDLGNQPSMIGAKLAPPQSGRRIIELLQILRGYPTAISFAEKQDFVISQAIPQYRYQYIFRGLLDKLVRKKKGFPEADVTAKSDEESFERQLKDFATRSDEYFDLNFHLLDTFVREMAAGGIGVIIVEGHYHPRALRMNEELHSLARVRLEKFAGNHPNSVYITTGDAFDASVYRDVTHVSVEAGIAFATSLRVELDRASDSIAKRRSHTNS